MRVTNKCRALIEAGANVNEEIFSHEMEEHITYSQVTYDREEGYASYLEYILYEEYPGFEPSERENYLKLAELLLSAGDNPDKVSFVDGGADCSTWCSEEEIERLYNAKTDRGVALANLTSKFYRKINNSSMIAQDQKADKVASIGKIIENGLSGEKLNHKKVVAAESHAFGFLKLLTKTQTTIENASLEQSQEVQR